LISEFLSQSFLVRSFFFSIRKTSTKKIKNQTNEHFLVSLHCLLLLDRGQTRDI
jgi:hypothetical protein